MPKVSVIIPCYNQGHFVDEAVDSVLAQTYDDYEIIIVNDGSSDPETNTFLSGYSKPKTQVIQTDNQGLAAARNNGIAAAQGEYILPLDADDRIGHTYLEKAVEILDDDTETGIVYCRAMLFGAQDTEWLLPDFSLQEMLLDNVIFCSAFFRKADWKLVGGYDTDLKCGWEDYDFWLSLLGKGRKVYRLEDHLFHYRVSEDSMVRARPRQHKLETFSRIYRKHQQLFADNIEVWIDKLLDIRNPYHEARLIINDDSGRDITDPGFIRKVDTSTRRLEFSLSGRKIERLTFLPAGDVSVVTVKTVKAVAPGGEEKTLSWKSSDGFVEDTTCYFEALDPSLEISMPQDAGSQPQAWEKLVVELQYDCLGSECFPYLLDKYKKKNVVGEKGAGRLKQMLFPRKNTPPKA